MEHHRHDVYRRLGEKIDNLSMRVPWNEALYKVLKELYTEEEADVVVRMPYKLSNLERISKVTGYPIDRLRSILEGLAEKGLVVDLCHGGEYHFMQSPLIVGIYEFTMMRTRGELNTKQWAELFHGYFAGSDTWYKANFNDGQKISVLRAIPHRGAVAPEEAVEILPYEKAEAIVAGHDRFAIGICSCRHEQLHLNLKACNVPLETCSSFGHGVEPLIRHGFAREASRQEMLDNLERAREFGLVLSAVNAKENVGGICCCCSCCCKLLRGINKFGYPSTLMTSSFIAEIDESRCRGCGQCARACPINAIGLEKVAPPDEAGRERLLARVNRSICLGCGVCSLKCEHGALSLKKRGQRVLHPENVFEYKILACLERGTLQNQIFDDPQVITHRVMRGMLGGFLRLPLVKRSLMSDLFRSRFLSLYAAGVKRRGKA